MPLEVFADALEDAGLEQLLQRINLRKPFWFDQFDQFDGWRVMQWLDGILIIVSDPMTGMTKEQSMASVRRSVAAQVQNKIDEINAS